MTSYEFQTRPDRPSDADRDAAIEVLKENAVRGRLSHDTFLQRMELAIAARGRDELDALVADLPTGGRMTRWATGVVSTASAFTVRLRKAWWAERLPKLMLPEPGPFPLRIGRDHASGLRIGDDSVSRIHAELRREGDVWVLRDLGSMNGTWINGQRLTGAATVRPGDLVTFGRIGFRLAAR
ncbi:FHA domain-containing protein [Streptantibioticus ferralitis]|uniref:DUF1707 and FHA domain-containing protein n=1 Tax=Streptantibioticus ferralitis TaxID=236510 RepID=A0ABT5Z4M6_9ACTN|nr:DUF1707 and FHA domain-containing protein [Streptantibioticus ferralitis]MDF2258703.1 DUF1707 and FHA domain-containing protein [Streptantibioticus ferralitis]